MTTQSFEDWIADFPQLFRIGKQASKMKGSVHNNPACPTVQAAYAKAKEDTDAIDVVEVSQKEKDTSLCSRCETSKLQT